MSTIEKETRVNVRIPARLAGQLRTVAERESNGISATIRRLLAQALAHEQRAERAASK